MQLNRRDFLKLSGVSAAAAGVMLFADERQALAKGLKDSRISRAKQVPSICPHCSVGCGMIAYVEDGKLLQLDGNPDSPISEGSLCPKGAGTFQFAYDAVGKPNPLRILKAQYRAPKSKEWTDISMDEALDKIAAKMKDMRDRTLVHKNDKGLIVNRLEGMAHIGSACLDNEECYLITKLMRTLGVVYLEHHARI